MRAFLARRPSLLPELVVVVVLLRVYDLVRHAAMLRIPTALANGQGLLDLERTLRLDPERAMDLWAGRHALWDWLAVHWYQYSHVFGTMTVLLLVWLWRPDRYRALRSALVLTNVIGLAVFLLVPVAPPRLLPGEGFRDAMALAGYSPSHVHVAADQYGAMPSLHVAWALWVAVSLGVLLPRWRRAVWLYPATTSVAVLLTGNHYLLDVAAGGAASVLALVAARALPGPVCDPEPREPRMACATSTST